MRHETELMRQILQSPSAQRMVDYVSPIYGEDYLALWLFEIMGRALDGAEEIGNSLWDQTVPQTATWTLPYWEEEYGAAPDPSWTVEQRQANILARIQYTAPVNPAKLAILLSAAAGVPCEIVENVSKNTFAVVLHGTTTSLGRVMAVLNEAKPAHLFVQFFTQVVGTFTNRQERFLFQRLSLAFRAAFHNAQGKPPVRFDGSTYFDSSALFNQAPRGIVFQRFRLRIYVANIQKGTSVRYDGASQFDGSILFDQLSGTTHLSRLSMAMSIRCLEHRTRTALRFGLSARHILPNVKLSQAVFSLSCRHSEQLRGAITIDNWRTMDGSILFDGTYLFNASIKKEDL